MQRYELFPNSPKYIAFYFGFFQLLRNFAAAIQGVPTGVG
jgi:hypothetical protein